MASTQIGRAKRRLVRWLGPWADGAKPDGVERTTLQINPRVRAYRYDSTLVEGTIVVAPGLHFEGPDDHRLDSFARRLARSGVSVLCPFLTDYLDLRLAPSVTDDLSCAVAFAADECRRKGLPKPALFSISFGAAPAAAVAASESLGDQVGSLILFGPFNDFETTVRFNITGQYPVDGVLQTMPRDPLNAPVIFLNILDVLDEVERDEDREALRAAWRRQTHRTWGRMELKQPGALEPIARAAATRLPEHLRALFLVGCGVTPGAEQRLDGAFQRYRSRFRFMEVGAHLANVRVPVTLVHGRDDDVIPFFESEALLRRAPSSSLLLTGLYGHTGASLPSWASIRREIASMSGIVDVLARGPRLARW